MIHPLTLNGLKQQILAHKNRIFYSPKITQNQWEKIEKQVYNNKVKGQVLYLLKQRSFLGYNSSQNQLQELQEGPKEPQSKGDQL